MSPYYDEGGVTIYQGDCRDYLADLHGFIVTDPPYGNGTDYDGYEDTTANLQGIVEALSPHLGNGAAVTCGVANVHRWPAPTWILAWVEPGGAGSGPWGFCCWQPILAYGPDPYLAAGLGRRRDIFTGTGGKTSKASHPDHPVSKPLNVMRWIIDRCSPPGVPIIDPLMGSGTTLIAAREVGRKVIGIDQSERYCQIAVDRLAQGVLIEPEPYPIAEPLALFDV